MTASPARRFTAPRLPDLYLPRSYLEAFSDPDAEGPPRAWVYRARIGEWKPAALARQPGEPRHFNDVEDPALRRCAELEEALAAVEEPAARLVRDRVAARQPLTPGERALAADFFALMGVRLSPRLAGIEETEAVAGFRGLAAVLREMGWVFWAAEPPGYFVTSSSPFLVAFPSREEEHFFTIDIHSPSAEVTLPLTRSLALHATWKRRGETWRRAGDDALLEINGRACQRAQNFLLAPKPAIPG